MVLVKTNKESIFLYDQLPNVTQFRNDLLFKPFEVSSLKYGCPFPTFSMLNYPPSTFKNEKET